MAAPAPRGTPLTCSPYPRSVMPVRHVPLLHAGYAQPSIEDYGGIGELTAGDPVSQHLGLGGTMAVASMVVPPGGGGGTTPAGAEGGTLPTGGEGGGGSPPAGAEGGTLPTGGEGGGGSPPTGGEGGGGDAVPAAAAGGGGTTPTGAEGGGDEGALAFTGFPAAAVGALGAVTTAAGVALRKAVRRHK